MCDTTEYLAPEILTRMGHGRAADWWSLGALLYEMLCGMPPFYSRDRDKLFSKILKEALKIPRGVSPEAKSLLTMLLDRNPTTRLGSKRDADEVKEHVFFKGVDWQRLYDRTIVPPFKPVISQVTDTSNFDQEFLSMPLENDDSGARSLATAASVSDGKFAGFTFVGSNDSGPLAATTSSRSDHHHGRATSGGSALSLHGPATSSSSSSSSTELSSPSRASAPSGIAAALAAAGKTQAASTPAKR
jgi:serine/threonine protein kinase